MIYYLNLPSEPISDQSDIESRIKALKEELRKRKFMAYQLKKEQKKRHKERLKAQEASLLKQLEVSLCVHLFMYRISRFLHILTVVISYSFFQSYDNFIEKTKAELNKEPDTDQTSDTKSQIKDSTSIAEQPSIKPPAQRYQKQL